VFPVTGGTSEQFSLVCTALSYNPGRAPREDRRKRSGRPTGPASDLAATAGQNANRKNAVGAIAGVFGRETARAWFPIGQAEARGPDLPARLVRDSRAFAGSPGKASTHAFGARIFIRQPHRRLTGMGVWQKRPRVFEPSGPTTVSRIFMTRKCDTSTEARRFYLVRGKVGSLHPPHPAKSNASSDAHREEVGVPCREEPARNP
jgi:hypothetical protein